MIVGLDLATSTGFAYGDGSGRPHVAALKMPSTGKDVGTFLVFFRDFLFNLVERLSRETRVVVVFEAPILPTARKDDPFGAQTNIMTTRKLQGLAGVVEMVVLDLKRMGRDVSCFETHLGTIKKELAGHGRAEKGDMVLAARRAGITLSNGKEGEDEADAFGAWLVGLRYHAPQHLALWDRVLGRAGLTHD